MKTLIVYLVPAFIATLIPTSAQAYIDPGTGSLIIQSIIAASVGLLFYLKLYWYKIKNIFTKSDTSKKADGVETTNASAKETDVTDTKDEQ